MFERLKKLYKAHKITEAGLDFWVAKGAITAEQKQQILAENDD